LENPAITRGINGSMEIATLAQQAGAPDLLMQFAPIIIIGAIFYVLIFLPMRKRQKKVDAMIAALKNGDRVITSSGIYGTVAGVKDKTFILKVADQVKIEVAKNAVTGLQAPDDAAGS
jgi:preprotein translocase subunit YajC